MGMGNLQRMALQMQQEMERIQAELAEARIALDEIYGALQ